MSELSVYSLAKTFYFHLRVCWFSFRILLFWYLLVGDCTCSCLV